MKGYKVLEIKAEDLAKNLGVLKSKILYFLEYYLYFTFSVEIWKEVLTNFVPKNSLILILKPLRREETLQKDITIQKLNYYHMKS